MPKSGACCICERDAKLVWHHCHLQKAVKKAMLDILVEAHGRVLTHVMFARVMPRWNDDQRVAQLLRFEKVRACELCNAIDILVHDERPGAYFSLSPNEIRAIRRAAGHNRNEGEAFFKTLSDLRFGARSGYLRQESEALALGRTVAHEWCAGDVVAKARYRIEDMPVTRLGFAELRVVGDSIVHVDLHSRSALRSK